MRRVQLKLMSLRLKCSQRFTCINLLGEQQENERMLAVIDQQIEELQSNKQALQTALSARFSTPIRPTNANLGVSAQ